MSSAILNINKYNKTEKKYNWEKCKTNFNGFIDVCVLTQYELKIHLIEKLTEYGYIPIFGDGYVYAKGEIPILLTAHMDTVHQKQCTPKGMKMRKENGNHIVTHENGIGGDDRCGIHMILKIIESGMKPYILFCEDEEIGSVGANKFVENKEYVSEISKLNYIIELDRANAKDAVFYDCDNEEFTKFIVENTGYEEAYGSWSDICTLSPETKIASVNFSCGYYNAHRTTEYVVIEEMENTIEIVKKLLAIECKQFEFIERVSYYNSYGYNGYENKYGSYLDWFSYYDQKDEELYEDNNDLMKAYEFIFYKGEKEMDEVFYGRNISEALGELMQNHPKVCFSDIVDWYIEDSYY